MFFAAPRMTHSQAKQPEPEPQTVWNCDFCEKTCTS